MNHAALEHPANARPRRRFGSRELRQGLSPLVSPDQIEQIRASATRVTHHTGGPPSSDLEDLGPEWVFCRWLADEPAWCRAAYEFASAG